jgi:hypothetical protein
MTRIQINALAGLPRPKGKTESTDLCITKQEIASFIPGLERIKFRHLLYCSSMALILSFP